MTEDQTQRPGSDTVKLTREQVVLQRVGQQLRDAREEAKLSQQEVADLFGWRRDAVSKLERGAFSISLLHYLALCDFFRDLLADHPGVALHDALYQKRPKRPG